MIIIKYCYKYLIKYFIKQKIQHPIKVRDFFYFFFGVTFPPCLTPGTFGAGCPTLVGFFGAPGIILNFIIK